MDRAAARIRGRAAAALIAVFAVLVMHGLTCMAGDAHTAGLPVTAAAPVHGNVEHCTDCDHDHGQPAIDGEPVAAVTLWAGGEHQARHGAAPCVATLTALAVLAQLAAAATTTSLADRMAGLPRPRLRPRPPTALLRPSLAHLCVLRM